MLAALAGRPKRRHGARLSLSVGSILALTLLLTPHQARAECSKAPGDLQKLVCEAPSLSTAWQEIEAQIATLKSSDADLTAALDADQALFGTLLNKTLNDLEAEHSEEEVRDLILTELQERSAFLSSVQTAKDTGVEGAWQNAAGYLRLSPTEVGGLRLQLSVMEPIMGLRTCSLDLPAKASGEMVTVQIPPSDEITFLRAGQSALLGVDFTHAGRPATGPVDCSESPSISGWYFSVKSK